MSFAALASYGRVSTYTLPPIPLIPRTPHRTLGQRLCSRRIPPSHWRIGGDPSSSPMHHAMVLTSSGTKVRCPFPFSAPSFLFGRLILTTTPNRPTGRALLTCRTPSLRMTVPLRGSITSLTLALLSYRTTEPYILPPKHPIRRLFTAAGSRLARHAPRFILFALAVAVAVSYPLLLQLRNHATGLYLHVPALASHAWTSVQPYPDQDAVDPDLILRQVWLHGDYMGAIKSPVLEGALTVQDSLLGPTAGCDKDVSRGSPASSFFHSPLLYWGCSHERLRQDPDLLRTVNHLSRGKSAANLTLKPSTVFAGKSFELGELAGADALVISLFYEPDRHVDEEWSARYQTLTSVDGWDVHSRDRNGSGSWLYELRYQPMTFLDYTLLLLFYGFMGAYSFANLMGLRILRSRLGLITVLITQVS